MRNRIIVCLILLGIWTILVLINNIDWFDSLVYDLVSSFRSDGMTSVMKIFTSFCDVKIIVFLSIISLLSLIWKRKESLYIVGTLGVAVTINLIFKNIFLRERPLNLRLIEETGFSYPSGHAMASMAFYGAILIIVNNLMIDKKYKYIISSILITIIFLVGISRVYLGVHYPSDIVGGWLISFVLLNILDYIIRRINESINNRS